MLLLPSERGYVELMAARGVALKVREMGGERLGGAKPKRGWKPAA
jgi:hypothetical protein